MSSMTAVAKRERAYPTSIGMTHETRNELKKVGQTGVPYNKTIMRILQVLKMYPEVRSLVSDYDYSKGV